MELSARLNPGEGLGDRVLKVNHAGEHGAVNIYAGQILVASLTAPDMLPQLREFQTHEIGHRQIFASELQRRGLKRCRSYPLCAVGGYLLGCVTALCGRSAIAATTVAVERVVLRHLEQQIRALAHDQSAVLAISRIIEEERAHRDVSHDIAAQNRFWTVVLSPAVALATETVIWIGMRI
jgi:ubiquinone biosynthesis monooxygenase Coq7